MRIDLTGRMIGGRSGSRSRRVARRCALAVSLLGLLSLLGGPMPTGLVGGVSPARAAGENSSWARTYHTGAEASGEGVLRLPDGDLAVTGTLSGRLLVTRLSPEGQVRWSKAYGTDATNTDIAVTGIPCSPTGMLVFREGTLYRLNDSGTVRWARTYSVYAASDTLRHTEFTDLVQLGDGGFVACGRAQSGVFICLLRTDGTPVWTKLYPLASFGRPRVFSLAAGGGFLLAGTAPDAETTGTSGAKLLWLNADGKVTRSLAYYDTTTPTSTYGQLMNAAMTPTGPVLCQWRYSDGCFGTNVIRLDTSGGVLWTTWIGGLRKGSADAGLWGIDAAADGSLLLVGATTEFSEHEDWGYDGMAEKLTADGGVAWVSTVDREVFTSAGHPGAVVAMDDGGLTWAATSHREGTSAWDAFVIRMGPDGTAGKLGAYLTRVDITNAKLVRVEHPAVTSQTASRDSQAVTCESKSIDVSPGDAGLAGSDVEGEALATLTLRPLYPANAATPSSIMQGGTMYRYFRVFDGAGKPVAGAELRYRGPFSSTTMTATSDASGELAFSFKVPRNTEPGRVDSTVSIDRVRVNGRRATLAAAPGFATDVLPLSWSTNWMIGNGLAGKVGLGLGAGVFGAAQQMGGVVVTRTAADPANGYKGSLLVNDSLSNEGAIGVQGEAGKLRLGTVQAKAADASAKISAGTFIDFATMFDQPSECSTSEKLMAALTLLCGVGQATSGGATTLLSVAVSAIVAAVSSDVDMEHLTGGVSLGVSGDVSALGLELAKQDTPPGGGEGKKTSLSGVSFGKLGVGERILLSITAYPAAGEASGKAALEIGGSFSVAEAFGYQLAGWSAANSVSAELVVDPLDTSFERVVLTASVPPDDRGESQETRLTIDRSVAGDAAAAVLQQVLPLVPGASPQSSQRLVFTREFCGQVLQNLAVTVASVAVPYEHVVTKDKNPTSIEVGLGVNILGNEVDLAIKPTWGRYQSFPLERGLFVALDDQLNVGRMVKLEEYPASLFSSQVDTLPDVIVELLEVVGELLSDVWDLAIGALSSAADTLLDVGAGAGSALGNGATALFQKGTSILSSPLGAAGDASLALLTTGPAGGAIQGSNTLLTAERTPMLLAASSTKRVTLVGAPSAAGGFCVGGIYALEPENGRLSKPATLTLRYAADAAGGRDPGTFSVYRYDAAARVWTPVESTHDRGARTLTATISDMGGYCIGSDSGAPSFALLRPTGSPAVVTTAVPQLAVACVEEGSGLAPGTFQATLDGTPLEAAWSAAAQCAVLTVTEPLAAGTHTLAVEGSDGAGNPGSATFEFEVRLPPGQAVLRVGQVTSGRVELQLEAGRDGDPPAAYDIWRTDPGPGLSYRRLGTVEAGASPTSPGRYADAQVLAGETYRYVAVALSRDEVEGPSSETLTVTVAQAPGGGPSTGGLTTVTTADTEGNATTTTKASPDGAAEKTGGLGPGAWLAIVVGVVVGVGLVATGIVFARRRRW